VTEKEKEVCLVIKSWVGGEDQKRNKKTGFGLPKRVRKRRQTRRRCAGSDGWGKHGRGEGLAAQRELDTKFARSLSESKSSKGPTTK